MRACAMAGGEGQVGVVPEWAANSQTQHSSCNVKARLCGWYNAGGILQPVFYKGEAVHKECGTLIIIKKAPSRTARPNSVAVRCIKCQKVVTFNIEKCGLGVPARGARLRLLQAIAAHCHAGRPAVCWRRGQSACVHVCVRVWRERRAMKQGIKHPDRGARAAGP